MLDILIRGGRVVDGTGNPAAFADIAVEGDSIVAVGQLAGAEAARVIDAAGKTVSPGFVDAHSHSDWSIHSNPRAESTIRQGITTEVVGQCGSSMAPYNERSAESITSRLRLCGYEAPATWRSFGEYLDHIDRTGSACNLAHFVGHNTVRTAAGVRGSEVSEAQIQTMRGFVREAIEAGAIGVSTGLEFEPGRAATTAEIQQMVNVAGELGAMHVSHIRNRDARLEEAVEEFLTVTTNAGARGEVSHLNVRHNTNAREGAWRRAVGMIERARQAGHEVLADTTPYLDGLGSMPSILPPWLLAEGPEKASQLLRDPAVRQRLRGECDRYWRFIHKGEWHRVSLQSSNEHPELCGKNFLEIADLMGKDPWDAYFDILADAGSEMGTLVLVARLFTEEHLADMVSHPLFSLGVDAFTSTTEGQLAKQSRHPLNFAGMIHYLTYHVREKGTLRLEEAIRKMTSMPATHHGLRDRGLLRPGFKADVLVFDLAGLQELSTVAQPLAYSRGVEHVVVNGVPVIADGEHTGALPGRNLRRA